MCGAATDRKFFLHPRKGEFCVANAANFNRPRRHLHLFPWQPIDNLRASKEVKEKLSVMLLAERGTIAGVGLRAPSLYHQGLDLVVVYLDKGGT